MPTDNLQRAAFSIAEFAGATGLSRDSVRRAITAGKLNSVRFSRRILIPASELTRLFGPESLPVQGTGQRSDGQISLPSTEKRAPDRKGKRGKDGGAR